MSAHRDPGTKRRTPSRRGGRVVSHPAPGHHTTHTVQALGVRRPVPVRGTAVERIAAVANCQRGRISRQQLRDAGVSNGMVARLIARSYLIRRQRGVYAVGHTAPRELAAETEALLACGPGATLSHYTAGRLWNILREQDGDGLVHITVPGRHGASPDGACVHRSHTLKPTSVHILHGLPVTSPGRALLDLAECLESSDLDWAIDEAVQRGLVSPAPLVRYARENHGRRGAAALIRAADRHKPTGITKSKAEKRYRALLRQARLPDPLTNVQLHDFEVDCYWPDHQLAVEIDSYQWHSSKPKFEHDSAKTASLVAAGLKVMRVTWHQMEDEPYAVVARTAQALIRAA